MRERREEKEGERKQREREERKTYTDIETGRVFSILISIKWMPSMLE